MVRRRNMYGCILAHRWFSDGEGWAYHPDLKPILAVLAEQLAPILGRRQELRESAWQPFRLSVPGGMLLGIHKRDDNCADLRARGRSPSILVAIYLPGPSAQLEVSWESLLEAYVPQTSGPDIRMRIKEAGMKTKIYRWRKWLMRALVLAIPLSIVAFAVVRGQQNPFKDARSEVRDEMKKLLEQTRAGVPDAWDNSTEKAKWDAFASVYCMSDLPIDSAHPDAYWAKILIPLPEKIRNADLQPQWRDYVGQLNEWAQHRGRPQTLSPTHPSSADASALLKEIVATLDYSAWLCREMAGNPEFRRGMCTGREPVVEDLRARAIAAGPKTNPQATWQVDYARACINLLAAWNVQEVTRRDVEDRPWFVLQAFFAFLNRERFEPLDAVQTIEAQFVSRLPATNALHEVHYNVDSEAAVKQGMVALITKLTGTMPEPSIDLGSAVGRIGDSMKYDTWFSQRDELVKGLKDKQRVAWDAQDYYAAGIIAKDLSAYEVDPAVVGTNPAMDEFIDRFKEGGQP